MTALAGLRILVGGASTPWAGELADQLAVAGAAVDRRCPGRDLVIGLADRPDIALVAGGSDPELERVIVTTLRAGDPEVPVALVTPGGELSASTASAGAIDLSAGPWLVEAVRAIASPRRRAREMEDKMIALAAAARASAQALAESQRAFDRLEHDLRTPLGIVVGFAANLRDGIDGPLTPEQRKHAGLIVDAAQGARSLLEEAASEVARATDALAPRDDAAPITRRVHRTHVAVSVLAEQIVALMSASARARDVELTAACTAGVATWGSAAGLRQLITNLVSNALKFTRPGGHVAVRVGWLSTGDGERRKAEIVVEDDGPGIPPEQRECIFEQGVRLERDASVEGQGIGLAVCRDVVAQHGGGIRVEDARGGGARFVVTLPQDRRERAGRGVVVVVRDEGEAAAILEAILAEPTGGLALASPASPVTPDAVVILPRGHSSGALDAAVRRVRQRQQEET